MSITGHDANIRAQIEFSGSYGTKRLTITDAASHLGIVEIELDAEMLMTMLSNQTVGSIEGVPAWFTPMPDKIGKTHVHVSVMYRPSFRPSDEQLTDWASAMCSHLGGTVAVFHRHNQFRVSVTVRHYLTESDAAAWKTWAQEQLDRQLVSAPGYDTPASDD